MKKNILKVVILTLAVVLLFGSISVYASNPYETYTYSIDGIPLKSPDAYDVYDALSSSDIGLTDAKLGGKELGETTDIVCDSEGNVYVVDKGNSRIIVLDSSYTAVAVIDSFVDSVSGQVETFSKPQGMFITDASKTSSGESLIYVCDTGNQRIVVLDRDYQHVNTFNCPDSPLLPAASFTPASIAVDIYGRIFLISSTCNEGVIVLSSQGEFTGYIGAQKVSYSLLQIIWRNFQTDEQKKMSTTNVSVSYNNITVDDDGFIYVTTDAISAKEQFKALETKSADYSPVKKLNSVGDQIMNRNGFFDPGGEVNILDSKDVSKINDVALGDEGMWTILDYSRSRFFTYDQDGNLLFAFGDSGNQLGNGKDLKAITYQKLYDVDSNDTEFRLLAVDRSDTGYKIIVYTPTSYCDLIIAALRSQNANSYAQSVEFWNDVLRANSNFDLAYIGIGKALFSQGKYDEAYETFQNAYETTYASKAYAQMRKNLINDNIFWLLLVAVVLIVGILKFLGYAKKKNKATTLKVGRKTYWEELLYSFHLVFHPFDGFWDLKHEKRGSVRAASTILGLTVITYFYNTIGKGYLFNPEGTYTNIFVAAASVLIPALLWMVANWCLTTLFDGEGSFKDIYIATCYSLAPLPLFFVVSTVCTNIFTTTEAQMVNLIVVIGFIWAMILLFFGMLVTHDYSMPKNVATVLGTILAMLIIMFIIILFGSLVLKMVSFVISLVKEITNRM